MTNEEAKKAEKELNALLNMCDPSPLTKELEDALKMAIKALEQQPNEDAVSRTLVHEAITASIAESENPYEMWQRIEALPSVTPKYTDEEIDKAQAVEQAYVDKMVELAVEESKQKWLNSFDTNSATKCFTAVNILKERLSDET